MARYLANIATGPELSKPLSAEQARDGMTMILRGDIEPAQAAVFLIALRMKRETHDELAGVLRALRDCADRVTAPVDDLVDIAEPYNGYVRHLPCAPFIPALLAACGVPCVLHGCREVGPKWGVTPSRILAAAGAAIDHKPAAAARSITDVGWAYVDQSQHCPALHRLARLRTLIVKRPCLSLVEKLIAPISASGRTHLWVGYAHREYPEILRVLARAFDYHSMLAVRGVEGGVLSSITASMRASRFIGGSGFESIEIAASEVVARSEVRAPPLPTERPDGPPPTHVLDAWATAAAAAGRAALAGHPGPTADMLVLGAAAMLRHLGRAENLAEGASLARDAITRGDARDRFEALCGGDA